MKLYNPFRPHIIQRGDKFLIRRFIIFGVYDFFEVKVMDKVDIYWWHDYTHQAKEYCLFDSVEEAQEAYEWRYKNKYVKSL